eukprot:6465015-Amphidinium_carterae.1
MASIWVDDWSSSCSDDEDNVVGHGLDAALLDLGNGVVSSDAAPVLPAPQVVGVSAFDFHLDVRASDHRVVGASALLGPDATVNTQVPQRLASFWGDEPHSIPSKCAFGVVSDAAVQEPGAKRYRQACAAGAVAIAASPALLQEAKNEFEAAVYARSTVAAHSSRLKLFRRVAEAAGVQAFPLTRPCVTAVAAVLRRAGYRSAQQVLAAAVKHHRREWGRIDETLEEVLKDCRRALNRDLGAPTRAPEIRLALWNELQLQLSSGNAVLSRARGEPHDGPFIWGFGSAWLLRASELRSLTMHAGCVWSDGNVASVTLAKTKTDQQALATTRRQLCNCSGQKLPSCPVCSLLHLVCVAKTRTGFTQDQNEAGTTPLIGTCHDASVFVNRAALEEAARKDA